MKTEQVLSSVLLYLRDAKTVDSNSDDLETLNDIAKAEDILRWVLDQRDEDGLEPGFAKFLTSITW